MKLIQYGDSGVEVACDDAVVSEVIQSKIKSGKYERHEAATIQKLVKQGDRLLELGAGVGLISSLAWRTGQIDEVLAFEADPRLIDLIHETFRRNSVRGTVRNEILSSSPAQIDAGYMIFHIREHFYGNSTSSKVGRPIEKSIEVPVADIHTVTNTFSPTLLACDIEGGELGLFKGVNLNSVRHIMLETHQSALGGAGMRDVFTDMHHAGFHFDERYSSGSVSVFSRVY